jgi:hypothetical protein
VLILGRPGSGADFDRAAGVLVPPRVGLAPRWRSLWNGTVHPRSRICLGTVTGLVGIGLVERFGLRESVRTGGGINGGVGRGAAAVFGVSGALTHLSCGALILAGRRALAAPAGSTEPMGSTEPAGSAGLVRPVAPGWSTALGVSAVATLGALAVFSADETVTSLRSPGAGPAWAALVTPFPFVLVTLLTFGALPAPLGGYLRPASISTGLLLYLAVEAAAPTQRI